MYSANSKMLFRPGSPTDMSMRTRAAAKTSPAVRTIKRMIRMGNDGAPARRCGRGSVRRNRGVPVLLRLMQWMMRALVCAVLVVVLVKCARGVAGRVVALFPSPSPLTTFLNDESLCGVVPAQLVRDAFSFRPTDYEYSHSSYSGRPGQDDFDCRIRGMGGSGDLMLSVFYISYRPGGYVDIHGRQSFDDLDEEGYDPLVLNDVEGRGYIWSTDSTGTGVITDIQFVWLYPDSHVLQFQLFVEKPNQGYGEDAVEGMRALAAVVVPSVPPIAAGPDQRYTRVPAAT